jgi:hypothetical protein
VGRPDRGGARHSGERAGGRAGRGGRGRGIELRRAVDSVGEASEGGRGVVSRVAWRECAAPVVLALGLKWVAGWLWTTGSR